MARNLMGGSARLPQSIAGRLGDRVRLNSPSTRVEQSEDGVVVTYRSAGAEHRVRARFAVIATPAAVARDVGAALPEDTARALGAIRYGHFLSMAVLTKEKHRMPWDDSYAIATPGLSFGVFFNQASVLRNSAERREGGSLMLFRGGTGAAELMEKSDAEIERLFMRDLEKLFPQAKGIVAETAIQRWPQGAPFAYSGRASLQPALTKPLGRIFLAGDYLEFPSMEAAISTGREAAEKIERQLIGSDDDTDRRLTVGNREHPLRPFLGPEHSGVDAIETAAVQPRNLRREIHPHEFDLQAVPSLRNGPSATGKPSKA